MRKLLYVMALLLALPFVAQAQEAPRVEIFGGYSYLRTDDNIPIVSITTTDRDLHGWNASFTSNLNSWFGVTADFSGHYGNYNVVGVNSDLSTHLFTFGPRFALRKYDRFTPYGHVLLGVARNSIDFNSLTVTSGLLNFNDSAFAMIVGGGVDININETVAFRLFQTDYVLTRFGGTTQNNFRASTGVLLKLGSQ